MSETKVSSGVVIAKIIIGVCAASTGCKIDDMVQVIDKELLVDYKEKGGWPNISDQSCVLMIVGRLVQDGHLRYEAPGGVMRYVTVVHGGPQVY